MNVAEINGIRLHYRDEGEGAPVVFCNSLGTDLRLWDKVVAHLPAGLRLIRYDKRGHGLTDAPRAPYSMGRLVGDAEALMEHLDVRGAVFVGCSIGGMVAQGLAAKRGDLLAGMVLSNTASKIGTQQMWDDRIAKVEAGGVEALADAVMERWFSPPFRETPELAAWRNMLTRTPADGYAGCSAAIAGTDFYTTTAALTLPTLGIGGDHDGSTPPDLVRETTELVQGGRFELIRGAGHLPMVEQPEAFAGVLTDFLKEVGHV
ncbi:3-oxoadipate enol-lactonase [Rhodobacteraceae bacterium WD3A24]|nr:3-oxoadipate enol-lactonase [Rhodobacteraceae bacterium WD3A24]